MIYKKLTLDESKARVEEMKKELKANVDAKVMIRQDRSYKGLEQESVWTFSVYFDTPTSKVTEAIKVAAYNQGFHCNGNYRVIGGSYGYIFHIRTP